MDTLFITVFAATYSLSLVCSCLLYILIWMAFPEVTNYRKSSVAFIIILSLAMNIHYARLDYNPGHHYNSLADYTHGKEATGRPGGQ